MTARVPYRAAILFRVSAIAAAALGAQACRLDMSGTNDDVAQMPEPVEAGAPAPPVPGGDSDAEVAPARDAQALDGARDDGAVAVHRDGGVDGAAPAPIADASAADARASDAADGDAEVSEVDAGSDADAGDPVVATDAGSDGAPADAGGPLACEISGRYALEIIYDVDWRGTSIGGVIPLLRPGRGQVRIWSLMDVRENGRRSRGYGCGVALPDFAAGNPSAGGEIYGAYIPPSSWEAASMPRMDAVLNVACTDPGCAITSNPVIATLGARITPNNPWPGRNGSLANVMLADHDEDNLPGLTLYTYTSSVRSSIGVPYSQPPLTWTLTPRATRLLMALQIEFQLDGAVESCDAMSGTIPRGRVENRVMACYARGASGGQEQQCTGDQARFADENVPEWTVRPGGRFRLRRLSEGATCEMARNALN
jgi:hypothetical protein